MANRIAGAIAIVVGIGVVLVLINLFLGLAAGLLPVAIGFALGVMWMKLKSKVDAFDEKTSQKAA